MRLPPPRRSRYSGIYLPEETHSDCYRQRSNSHKRHSSRTHFTSRAHAHRDAHPSYREYSEFQSGGRILRHESSLDNKHHKTLLENLPSQTARLLRERPRDRRLQWVVERMCKRRPRDVFLKVYDITEGRAARWLEPIIGVHVEGIWHTGICCFDQEHFYCDGIQSLGSHLVELKFSMTLRDILYLGKTRETKHDFYRFMRHNAARFSPQKYDLIEWNCNHFTDLALRYLFPVPRFQGSSKALCFTQFPAGRLPDFIVRQPKEFMSTVRGRLLIWMTKHVLEKVDNFLNQNFAAGLDQIIARWTGGASSKNT